MCGITINRVVASQVTGTNIGQVLASFSVVDCLPGPPQPNRPLDEVTILITFTVLYVDSVLNKVFTQYFYFEWPGVIAGVLSPILTHGLMDRETAEICLKKYLDEFSTQVS
jgi:hypothetical protein